MLLKTQLPRIFRMDNAGTKLELADPNPGLHPESVQNFYAATYPLLTTANIEGPEIINDRVEYRFVTNIGTKG